MHGVHETNAYIGREGGERENNLAKNSVRIVGSLLVIREHCMH